MAGILKWAEFQLEKFLKVILSESISTFKKFGILKLNMFQRYVGNYYRRILEFLKDI